MTLANPLSLIWLRESFPWMGQHSGYELLCDYLTQLECGKTRSIWNKKLPFPSISGRVFNRISSHVSNSLTYNSSGVWLEIRSLLCQLYSPWNLAHVVYLERALGVLPILKERFSYKLIATAHQPSSLWRIKRHNPQMLKSLDSLLVLSSKEAQFFEEYLPNRVHFIRHGVDLEFFSPRPFPSDLNQASHRCVFSGIWLRDLETLADVIDRLLARNPNIIFDLIVPIDRREHPCFFKIARHHQVIWHAGVSDVKLREIYRNASLLLLPLIDCTANNALLEAIACGLPIVTTDVGGIPDYTEPSFARLSSVRDVDGLVNSVEMILSHREKRKVMGEKARQFAVEKLSWKQIAQQTLDVYLDSVNNSK